MLPFPWSSCIFNFFGFSLSLSQCCFPNHFFRYSYLFNIQCIRPFWVSSDSYADSLFTYFMAIFLLVFVHFVVWVHIHWQVPQSFLQARFGLVLSCFSFSNQSAMVNTVLMSRTWVYVYVRTPLPGVISGHSACESWPMAANSQSNILLQ